MPYKDPDKRREASIRRHKIAYYSAIAIRFRRDNPDLYDGLCKAAQDSGITITEYCKTATVEKLITQGYYQENQEQN